MPYRIVYDRIAGKYWAEERPAFWPFWSALDETRSNDEYGAIKCLQILRTPSPPRCRVVNEADDVNSFRSKSGFKPKI